MSPATATRADAPSLPGVHRALVVGLGASGLAAARALRSAGVAVVLADDAPSHPAAAALRADGYEVALGRRPVEALDDDIDLIVPSPGVPERAPVLVTAAERGLPIWSEPELGLRLHPRTLVGVTGTNGKTSVTELVTAMLRAGGTDAVACGNIGTPVCEAAAVADQTQVLVAELSSFQLRFAGTLRPRVGLLLNLAPDHLDWHGDLAAYGAAKARIWEAQGPGDWAVANADDPVTTELADTHAPAGHARFSGTRAVTCGVGVEDGVLVARVPQLAEGADVRLLDVAALPAPAAPHVVANVAAAATAAALEGIAPEAIASAARSHRPGRHRFEQVAVDARGVRYVDDSKATNVHAAIASLRASGSTVWIAGGVAKGVALDALGDHLQSVRAAVLIGDAADELAAICERAGVGALRADDLEAAVVRAAALASPGDTVLLAPACASFDQFRDYAERGERFAAAARAIAGEVVVGEGTP